MKILITESGFIENTENLLNAGYKIYGIDNLNNYYNVKLKLYRLSLKSIKLSIFKIDISNTIRLKNLKGKN